MLNINAMPGLASDYTGTYSSLGSAGGKPRFVRADNEAVLQYAIFDGEGFWLLTGLGTTFSVSPANRRAGTLALLAMNDRTPMLMATAFFGFVLCLR